MSETYRNESDEHKWFIARDGGSIIHHGIMHSRQEVTTGQPYLEILDSVESYHSRCVELGIEPEVE